MINKVEEYFSSVDNFSLSYLFKFSVDYVFQNIYTTFAIIIHEGKNYITDKEIKALSIGIREFNEKYPNAMFFYFIKHDFTLKPSAKFYLDSDDTLLNYIDLSKNSTFNPSDFSKNVSSKVLEKKPIIASKSKDVLKSVGDDYEIFCGGILEEKGFIVKYNGLENGVNDKSIDVIAIKKGLILLIQCKNWHVAYCKKNGYLSKSNFKSFVGQCDDFVACNKVYQDFVIHKYWFVHDIETVDKTGIDYANSIKKSSNFFLQEIPFD
jgi:Holliday junction resolvase